MGVSTPQARQLLCFRACSSNPRVFYKLLLANTEEILPYVYTPTVGQACTDYHKLPNFATYGIYLRATDKGHFLDKLRAYPEQDIRVSAHYALWHQRQLCMDSFLKAPRVASPNA